TARTAHSAFAAHHRGRELAHHPGARGPGRVWLAQDLRAERFLELAERIAVRFLVEGGDTFFDDLDGVTEIPRIRGVVEHAEVGAVTDEPEGIHAALAQRDIEVGAGNSGVPST